MQGTGYVLPREVSARLLPGAGAERQCRDSRLSLGAESAAGQDQFQRARLAHHARQALGAAVAGDQAELDLRKAELGAGAG